MQSAIERFRHDLLALTDAQPSPHRPLGVAVSGGPDSMALLRLAAAAFPGAVVAATVDHGLRPEAAREAQAVHDWCAARDIPHAILTPDTPIAPGNVQAGARAARYDALARWAAARGVRWIATAHHRDDVAETFLLRAARGAGIGGLAEMARARASASGAAELVRPLLDWSRAELLAVATADGAPIADDPSNRDDRYDRARIRALLAGTPALSPARLALTARNLRAAEDALAWVMLDLVRARLVESDDAVEIDPRDLPAEFQRRLLIRAIETARRATGDFSHWRETGIDRLHRALLAGRAGTIAGIVARMVDGRWRITKAPPRRSH